MFKNRLFEISTGIWNNVPVFGGVGRYFIFDKVRQMEGMGVLNQILIEINIINDIYTTVYKLWARLSCLKVPMNWENIAIVFCFSN